MITLEMAYWSILITLLYSYIGYGLLIFIIGIFIHKQTTYIEPKGYKISLLIVAHNEEANIKSRIDNALSQHVGNNTLNIVIVSDGSTDDTVKIANKYLNSGIRVIETNGHIGKAAALNEVMDSIKCDILVFSDANTIYKKDSIFNIIRHFEDENIGGVCGKLQVPAKKIGWLGKAENMYWAYENKIKMAESRLGSTVSAQGSVYAIRRSLYREIPPGVADDFFQSAQVISQGRRLIFDDEAISEEYVSNNIGGEFGRRVRSTQQGWHALTILSELLNPFRYGIYSLQLFSHKLLRRLTPFLLPFLLLSNTLLLELNNIYRISWWLQVSFYSLALLAWLTPAIRKIPGITIPLFFVSGHVAMGIGVIRALSGCHSKKWTPLRSGQEK